MSVLALAAGLACAELVLRRMGYAKPVLLDESIRDEYRVGPNGAFTYYGYLPGAVIDFANPVKLNALGFHDRNYAPARPSPTTYRLMVLGDSYVAGWEVPLEATFHKRIEARLTREDPLGRGSYQVIALGQGRTAQEQEIRWMEKFAPIYQPDAILILFFCGNDFMENDPAIFAKTSEFANRYIHRVAPRKNAFFHRMLLFPSLRLNGLFAEAATDYYVEHLDRYDPGISRADLESPELGLYENPLPAEWSQAFAHTGALLAKAQADAERFHARFLLASLSGPQAIGDLADRILWAEPKDPRFDYGRGDRWIRDWADRHGVPHLELGPPLAKIGRRKMFWKHDQHLRPEGHAAVATLLYDFVVTGSKSDAAPTVAR